MRDDPPDRSLEAGQVAGDQGEGADAPQERVSDRLGLVGLVGEFLHMEREAAEEDPAPPVDPPQRRLERLADGRADAGRGRDGWQQTAEVNLVARDAGHRVATEDLEVGDQVGHVLVRDPVAGHAGSEGPATGIDAERDGPVDERILVRGPRQSLESRRRPTGDSAPARSGRAG